MSLSSAAARRLQALLSSVAGSGAIGHDDGQVYAAGTLGAKVKAILAGPTFTGPVVLPGNAGQALQAVPLQQLTSVVGQAVAAIADGQTFTGPVLLPGAAAAPLEAVTLQQVQDMLSSLGAASQANFAPGDIAFSALATNPTGLRRVLVTGACVDLAGVTSTLAPLWCGAGRNADADFYFRCTNPADPAGTRADGGQYLKLPDPGYFLRILNPGALGIDIGRDPFKYQNQDIQSHGHPFRAAINGPGGDAYPGGGNFSGNAGLNTDAVGGAETRPKNWGAYVWMWY
jgi:hypothetical protein